MITLYSGTPGSGKSYHIAQRVYKILRHQRQRVVVTNILFNLDAFSEEEKARVIYLDNGQVKPQILAAISEKIKAQRECEQLREGTLLLVLDECQLLFNARTWQLNDNGGWIRFFTQHRKLGYDVVMVAQYDRMIDRQIRSLIEYEVIHRKISRFGLRGKLLSVLVGNFVAVSVWYGIKEVVDRDYIRYSRKVATLYDTYQVWT